MLSMRDEIVILRKDKLPINDKVFDLVRILVYINIFKLYVFILEF